jgi:hypothetical protein
MKTRLTALMVFAFAIVGFADIIQETNRVARQIPIGMRAMQMQAAVLKDQNLNKIEELLKQGVDINAPIGCGTYAPLDGAVDRANLDMLKFLLAHGAKPRGRELPQAAFIDNAKTALNFVKVLLAADVDPNATNDCGSALGCAAFRGNRDLVILLLARPHIKLNIADGSGYTALMEAADNGFLDIVDLLVKAGADTHLKSSWGETATDMAERVIATKKAVGSYVYVSGGVVKPGCYHWFQKMTALDAIRAADGFTNFVSGPILITHIDNTCEIWVYPPATTDASNEPPVLSRNNSVYAAFFERSRS